MDGLFLLLGSNIPDQRFYLSEALRELQTLLGDPISFSSLYRTEPWGEKDQKWFLNQVVVFKEYRSDPLTLLGKLKEIEHHIGRTNSKKWGPREIDIDILYNGETIFNHPEVKIPHPLIQERKFTLIPLVEVAPDKIHPGLQKTQKVLLKECNDLSEVITFSD